MHIDGLDEIDNKILDIIKDDARLSYSEIAERVGGITRVAVKNRMNALKEKGIIMGYKTIVNPTGDINGVKFIMDVEAEPEKFYEVVDMLAKYRFNRQIYTASGESRIHVIGYAPNYATYKSYVDQVFRKLEGVKRIIFHQLLVTHKDVDGGVEYVRQEENGGIQPCKRGTGE